MPFSTGVARTEVADIARRTGEHIEKILQAHGRSLDPEMQSDEPVRLALDEPALAACYAAAAQDVSVSGERAGQPPLRLILPREPPPALVDHEAADEPVAEVRHKIERAIERIHATLTKRARPDPFWKRRTTIRATSSLTSWRALCFEDAE